MTTPEASGGGLERALTYGVPVASVVVAALVVLGPGAPRASTGVRVLGHPVRGSSVIALRLVAVRRLYGVDEVVAGGRVSVEASEGAERLGGWEGPIGDDGVGEALVRLARPAARRIELRVRDARAPRAWGTIEPADPAPLRRGSAVVAGVADGEIAVEVRVPRGLLAPPSPEAVRVREASGGARDVSVTATAPGAELGPALSSGAARLPDGAPLAFEARALAHDVELALEARDGLGRRGRWEGRLPVVPGAIWLDPAPLPARVRVVTPAPRDHVYVSVVGPDGDRLFGAAVPVAREAGAAGVVDLPPLPVAPAAVVVAGDPMEKGAGTVAWPVAGEGAIAAPPLDVLVDGMPEVEAREAQRALGARRSALGLLAAAAVAEALLLARQSRRSRRRLEAHLAAAGTEAEASRGAGDPAVDLSRTAERGLGFGLAVYAALILLAFAMVGALASFR